MADQPFFNWGNGQMGSTGLQINPLNNNTAFDPMSLGQFGQTTQSVGGGFDWGKLMGNVGTGLDAFSALAGIYGMFKNLKLQDKSFKLAKQGTIKNFNANAQAFNNAVDDQYGARAASARYNGRDMSTLANYQPENRKIEMWG